MRNWYEIAEPHEDIKNQNFRMDVFAADIGDVVTGSAPIDYGDPDTFARKTYFTNGLTKLLKKVHKRLTKGQGDSIIELQTPFGGGKTHSLLSIYHYINSGDEIINLLPDNIQPIKANNAVVSCDHLNAQEGRKVDDLQIKTLWGEIAYRLGGKEGYNEFRNNDENKVSPGSDKLKSFLEKHTPFVLLFDEVLEYISNALGVQVEKSNLGSQTYSFLKGLTKAVGSIENGLLVVTLPSSELEDFTPKKEEGLATLNKIFGRVETIESPVTGEEIYTIIQKRLFQNVNKQEKNNVIHDYFENYRNNKENLPAKASEKDYKEKMKLAYPFHPETIDILHEKWGTFSSFQRTRGVLRLLARVVGDIYESEKNIDFILPSDINLNNDNINQEFTKHIGPEYDSIIAADISGHDAKAQGQDRNNKNWDHLAERIATSIFYHSFTAEESEKGCNIEQIKLSTLRPDIMPSLITEVKEKLAGELWYLNEKDNKYYFSTIPNLNRMIRDKKDLIHEDKNRINKQLKRIIDDNIGNALKSYVWPRRPNDIPDNQKIKLVILNPDNEHDLDKWLEKRKNKPRVNKNTIIFGIADDKGTSHIRDQIKEYLALKEIKTEIQGGDNKGLESKLSEVEEKIESIEKDFSYNVRKMYNTIQAGEREMDLGMPIAGNESLSNWYKQNLENEEEILVNLHYRLIINKFLVDREYLKTKSVLEQFYKNTSMPMLKSDRLIKQALAQAVSDGKIGIGHLKNDEIDKDTLHFKEDISELHITFAESEIMINEKIASKLSQETEEVQSTEEGSDETETIDTGSQPIDKEEDKPDDDSESKNNKYKKVKLKIDGLPSSKLADFSRGVIIPLAKVFGEFEFNVEIDIEDEEGISKRVIEEKVKETIRQLNAVIKNEELR